jgi:hypothetical protein
VMNTGSENPCETLAFTSDKNHFVDARSFGFERAVFATSAGRVCLATPLFSFAAGIKMRAKVEAIALSDTRIPSSRNKSAWDLPFAAVLGTPSVAPSDTTRNQGIQTFSSGESMVRM